MLYWPLKKVKLYLHLDGGFFPPRAHFVRTDARSHESLNQGDGGPPCCSKRVVMSSPDCVSVFGIGGHLRAPKLQGCQSLAPDTGPDKPLSSHAHCANHKQARVSVFSQTPAHRRTTSCPPRPCVWLPRGCVNHKQGSYMLWIVELKSQMSRCIWS